MAGRRQPPHCLQMHPYRQENWMEENIRREREIEKFYDNLATQNRNINDPFDEPSPEEIAERERQRELMRQHMFEQQQEEERQAQEQARRDEIRRQEDEIFWRQNYHFPRRIPPNWHPTRENPYFWPELAHIVCKVCGFNGHYNADCPFGAGKCYNCNQVGHISRECRVPRWEWQDGGRRHRLIEENMYCAICMVNVRMRVYMPCHHLAICEASHERMILQPRRANQELECPICREPVIDNLRVYL